MDDETIDALRRRGAHLEQRRATNHYLYLPDRSAAGRVAAALARGGRTVRVKRIGTDWVVVVTQPMIVNSLTIRAARAEFDAIATSEGGDYDGWEAAVD